MNRLSCALLAGALMLSACADPEKSAQKSLDAGKADWDKAGESLDPQKRVKAYQSAIDGVESLARKFKKTPTGQALAAGRTAGGVSLPAMKSDYERLAERAACYGAPTPECLLPFASSGFRDSAAAGSAEDAGQAAMRLVCEKNFAKAETALEPLKINRPVYAANLVQVALQAAQCDKPAEVKAAIAAYMAAEPSVGADRVGALLSILQTDQLEDAWPMVLTQVEKEIESAGLAPGEAANVDLTLAVKYAAIGEAASAVRKFTHVTDELGYGVDVRIRIDLASALLASGHPQEAMSIAGGGGGGDLRLWVVHGAAQMLGGRLGVIRSPGAATANVPYTGDLSEFLAAAPGDRRKHDAEIAGQIEAELDKFVAERQPTGEYLGMVGCDTVYGMLALIQQKLGDSAKATALAGKGEKTREALSRPGSYNPEAQNYLAEFQLLVAIAQGDTDGAAALYGRVIPVGNDPVKLILVALARKGEAEKALTFAAATNRASGQTYELLINELGAHGHGKEAEAVLAAFPGDAGTRSALAWGLVEKAAAAGDLKTAESAAEKYSLLNIPAYRLRMSELKAEAAIAKKDRGKAEAAIREMFALGDALDKEAAQSQARGYYAQNAAAQAFKAGYADLGIELYRAASIKDQRPLFEAFSERSKPADFPKVLMTAHDNLQGEALGYVIDSAIRRLEEKK